MKKILLYTDTPQIGGAELQMFLLAKFLDKEKFTPIIACSAYPGLDKWCEKFEKEGIDVLRLDVRHKHDPRHYFQLKKIIKRENIDLLHAHVWNPASCRYAYALGNKVPLVTTEHDPFHLPAFKNFFKKRSLKKVKKIVAISQNNKELLETIYPKQAEKLKLIHNGIDTTWWQSQLLRVTEKDIATIKKDIFKAKEDTFIITCIAELHERKGQKYLLEAIPDIVADFPNTKVVFIGDGPGRDKLEKLIKKLKIEQHAILIGKKKRIPRLLKSSNIFCLPSRREGFGLVNLEAMMIPLPIVATKVGGIPEVVTDNGILVESEDSKALGEALKKLISNKDLREKMANAGYERILKHFDAKKMAEQYESVYGDILEKL